MPLANPTERLIAGALEPRDNRIANAESKSWHERVMAMKAATSMLSGAKTTRQDLTKVARAGLKEYAGGKPVAKSRDFVRDLSHVTGTRATVRERMINDILSALRAFG